MLEIILFAAVAFVTLCLVLGLIEYTTKFMAWLDEQGQKGEK